MAEEGIRVLALIRIAEKVGDFGGGFPIFASGDEGYFPRPASSNPLLQDRGLTSYFPADRNRRCRGWRRRIADVDGSARAADQKVMHHCTISHDGLRPHTRRMAVKIIGRQFRAILLALREISPLQERIEKFVCTRLQILPRQAPKAWVAERLKAVLCAEGEAAIAFALHAQNGVRPHSHKAINQCASGVRQETAVPDRGPGRSGD
jgi:hypothetical protein